MTDDLFFRGKPPEGQPPAGDYYMLVTLDESVDHENSVAQSPSVYIALAESEEDAVAKVQEAEPRAALITCLVVRGFQISLTTPHEEVQ